MSPATIEHNVDWRHRQNSNGCHSAVGADQFCTDATGVVPGAGIDGFYRGGDGLCALHEWGLLEVFGVEALEERAGLI